MISRLQWARPVGAWLLVWMMMGGCDNYAGGLFGTWPSITVTAPNGGETWWIGTQATVTWESAGAVEAVVIELSADGGETWPVTLAASTANDGAETVTVPNAPGTQCRVRVSDTGGDFGDISNADFTIEAAVAPQITTHPSDRTVTEGETAAFTVEATGTLPLSYQWQVDDGGGWQDVTTGTGGDTDSYTTAATVLADDGNRYRCIVSNGFPPDATSDPATLTVLLPAFAVTSPNGGEVWQRGTEWTVTWNPTGLGGDVRIELGHQGTDPVLVPEGEWTGTTDTAGSFCPSARQDHSAVWTGSRMIVWGGIDAVGPTDTGAVYDPATDTWESLTATDGFCPTSRQDHTAAWTGSRMIVWGGTPEGGSLVGLDDGAVYDPATNVWESETDTLGAECPSPRWAHSAVWSGTRMIVWGGGEPVKVNTGAIYDHATDTWESATSTAGLCPTARGGHSAAWTGARMVVWGGYPVTDTGAIYDPGTNTWESETSTGSGMPSARYGPTAVWTGSRMIVWGGTPSTPAGLNTGAIYDPATDTWETATSTDTDVPTERYAHAAVWTGTRMIVWGGNDGSGPYTNTGAFYDPPGWHVQAVLADSTPDDGSLIVSGVTTATLSVGDECRVRVTHIPSGASDDSDGDFTVAP